eukprot:maker-scaffold_2-snap-gene-6.45-mRNA-1 protein AED:0.25 eAED:0.25 QI:1108/1/1/1/0.5/0.33/3/56/270
MTSFSPKVLLGNWQEDRALQEIIILRSKMDKMKELESSSPPKVAALEKHDTKVEKEKRFVISRAEKDVFLHANLKFGLRRLYTTNEFDFFPLYVSSFFQTALIFKIGNLECDNSKGHENLKFRDVLTLQTTLNKSTFLLGCPSLEMPSGKDKNVLLIKVGVTEPVPNFCKWQIRKPGKNIHSVEDVAEHFSRETVKFSDNVVLLNTGTNLALSFSFRKNQGLKPVCKTIKTNARDSIAKKEKDGLSNSLLEKTFDPENVFRFIPLTLNNS